MATAVGWLSGNDIGKQLILDGGNPVLEGQLALLQPLDLQLIAERRADLRHDLQIELPVLGPEPRQLLAELALVRSLHRPYGPSAGKPPALEALVSSPTGAGKPAWGCSATYSSTTLKGEPGIPINSFTTAIPRLDKA